MMNLYKCPKCGFVNYSIPNDNSENAHIECVCCNYKSTMIKLSPKEANKYLQHNKDINNDSKIINNCRVDGLSCFKPA